jgi:co-chaperonin GroES (HSP10)
MQLLGNTVLVRLDSESNKTLSGTLFKPDGAHEHVLRTGEVVDVGLGKYLQEDQRTRMPFDIKVGEGVVFVKFLADKTGTAQGIQKFIPEGHAILQLSDIMLAYDRSDPPEFSQ